MTDHYLPRNRDDFEIAIICALSLERNAVQALLDDEYETDGHSYGKAVGDKNAYTTGRLGNQHVVIAHMPSTGTVSAATVAAHLTSSFERIKVALVVGVCGGIPMLTGKEEILLGDVVISTSVVQIDFGRQYPNGFKAKTGPEDTLGRANPEIRAFLGKISDYRAKRRLRGKTRLYVAQISSIEGFASYTYPGPECDTLYNSGYRHKHRIITCEICDQCETHNDDVCDLALRSDCDKLECQGIPLKDRKRLQNAIGLALNGRQYTAEEVDEARRPALHFGRIASGNYVMTSGFHRDQIAAKEKVIGFEMESAGTWDSIPTIVVKGVSDYADSHKSKKWQGYAAAVAAACTKAILEEWRSVDRSRFDSPPPPTYPVHWTVTRPINTLFTGRRDVLHDLSTVIRTALKDKSQQNACHIVISGMGGQGKSEICLQLAQQLRHLFWGVFWVDVSSKLLAENGFLNVGSCLNIHVTSWEAARQMLSNVKEKWLLILDNADDPEVDYHQYFPASTFGVVILTSRNAECRRYATKRWIDLQGLAAIDALELLFQTAYVTATEREALEIDAQVVARLLQSHPLALTQAGAYITRGHCSFKDYPRHYERQRKRLLDFRPSQAQSRYCNVYATFEASATTLERSTSSAATDALQLISVLAMYGPNHLPLHLFEAACKGAQIALNSKVAGTGLYSLTAWHTTHLPSFISVEDEAWDSFRLIEAVNLLKVFSLISIDVNEGPMFVSIHPLVHAWAKDRLSPEQKHRSWVQAGCIIALSRGDELLWLQHGRQLQPHLRLMTSWPLNEMFSSEPVFEICCIVVSSGQLLLQIRDDAHLLNLMDRLLGHLQVNRQIVDPRWIGIYHLTAQGLYNTGRSQKAVALLEQVVQIQEQTLAKDHPSRPASQHELAGAYQANGQVKEAVPLLQQVVQIREQTLAKDHPSRLASEQVLASCLWEVGDKEAATILMQQVVSIQKHSLDELHPNRINAEEWLRIFMTDMNRQ